MCEGKGVGEGGRHTTHMEGARAVQCPVLSQNSIQPHKGCLKLNVNWGKAGPCSCLQEQEEPTEDSQNVNNNPVQVLSTELFVGNQAGTNKKAKGKRKMLVCVCFYGRCVCLQHNHLPKPKSNCSTVQPTQLRIQE